jgi:hypothetical protein
VLNIRKRNNTGGPAPEEIARAIGKARGRLDRDEKEVLRFEEKIDRATGKLMEKAEEANKGN